MARYLVKMTPLSPYAFGTDMKFNFPGDEKTGKESYIVVSKLLPEQTTLLGMLRYMVLDSNNVLQTNGKYSDQDQKLIRELIGKESFSFKKKNQTFGKIKSISPVFILRNNDNKIFIKNPFHNINKNGTHHFATMENEKLFTSYGEINLPSEKIEVEHIFVNVNLEEEYIEESKLFQRDYQVGIKKNRSKNETEDDSFFKQEFITLLEGYSFGIYVECDKLPEKSIQYMGQKKSAFLIEAIPQKLDSESSLDSLVKKRFRHETGSWFYALSDIYLDQPFDGLNTFSIVEKKSLRNLETDYQNGKLKTKRTNIQFNLISSGSVFFEMNPLGCIDNSKDYKYQVGYNHVIQIGGNH